MTTETETTMKAISWEIRRKATEAEVAESGRQIAAALRLEEDVLREKHQALEEFKERLEGARADIRKHRTAIDDGEIVEKVEASLTLHPNEARAVVARLDTGEILHERAMTAEELEAHRQLSLAPAPAPDNLETFPVGQCSCGSGTICAVHAETRDES